MPEDTAAMQVEIPIPAMRLLIVDDHTQMRRMIRSILAQEADEVREAEDGNAAVDSFRAFRPDWTIMDLQMPKVGGLEATRRILQVDPGARVVIVSENDEPQLESSAEEAGAKAFVTKDRLLDLNRMLGRWRATP